MGLPNVNTLSKEFNTIGSTTAGALMGQGEALRAHKRVADNCPVTECQRHVMLHEQHLQQAKLAYRGMPARFLSSCTQTYHHT